MDVSLNHLQYQMERNWINYTFSAVIPLDPSAAGCCGDTGAGESTADAFGGETGAGLTGSGEIGAALTGAAATAPLLP